MNKNKSAEKKGQKGCRESRYVLKEIKESKGRRRDTKKEGHRGDRSSETTYSNQNTDVNPDHSPITAAKPPWWKSLAYSTPEGMI